MSTRLCGLILFLATAIFAAQPIATLTAGPGVTLNGKSLQATGAPNWPLSAKDEIVTTSAQAAITLSDGTVLNLQPNTRVVLFQCDRCVVQLFTGSVSWRKPAGSAFEFCALGRPVRPEAPSEGTVTIEHEERVVVQAAGNEQLISAGQCACNAGAAWAGSSKKAKIAIVAVAAAAATGVTIAVTRSDDKSPTTR